MNDVDLTRLPTGALSWGELVTWAVASDDRVERYFLELKSDVDLNTKHGRHKVAKFILGAMNRDPAEAAKRFGGHAVMLLGIGSGQASGISGFEAQDLRREVQKFTGVDGPLWDYERIPVDGGRDVIAVIVDPPTGDIRPCLSDGEGMNNGDVYLRKDGNTEKATGAELKAMLTRRPTPDAVLPGIEVEVIGEAVALGIDEDAIAVWVERTAEAMLSELSRRNNAYGAMVSAATLESRSEDEFKREVERWRENAQADLPGGLEGFATQITAGIAVRIINPSRTALRDVRVEIEFEGPFRALEWEDEDDDLLKLFPDRPLGWGRSSVMLGASLSSHYSDFIDRGNADGVLVVEGKTPARLSVSLDLLRPEQTYTSAESEAILVSFVASKVDEPLSGRWKLTAGDVNDVRDGVVVLPVTFADVTPQLHKFVGEDSTDF